MAAIFTFQLSGAVDIFADKVTVEFRNYDDSYLFKDRITVGSSAIYSGELPTRKGGEDFDYVFTSWDKPLTNIVRDTVFHAQFQNVPKQVKVTFQNYNQKELYKGSIPKGATAVYYGPVPTREPDEYYTYKFRGWDKDLENIQEDTIFTAEYDVVGTDFKVTFYNYDDTILDVDYVPSGGTATYRGITPQKPSTKEYEYIFNGWDESLFFVSRPLDVHAVYEAKKVRYTVNFYNYDGTLLYTDYVSYKGDAEYNAPTPTRPASVDYVYVFKGWNKSILNVTENLDVIATYETRERDYLVEFYNYDNTLLYSTNVEARQPAFYSGVTPSRPDDEKYTYDFIGWDRDLNSITQDTITYALYQKELRKFVCTFKNYDGEPLYVDLVTWGQTAKYYGETPFKPGDSGGTYNFIGWDKELTEITEDTTFTAQFEYVAEGGGNDEDTYYVFRNYDGTAIEADAVKLGEHPFFFGDTPTREPGDKGGIYTFAGWTVDLEEAGYVGPGVLVNVYAQYTWQEYDWSNVKYIVTYRSRYEDLLYEDYVSYGGSSKYRGEEYDYLLPENGFVGWSEDVSYVTSSITVFPRYL